MQNLIVLGHGYAENYGRYILEAMDPLLSLRSLSADIKEPEEKCLNICTEDERIRVRTENSAFE